MNTDGHFLVLYRLKERGVLLRLAIKMATP